ncbi:MAG: Ig-like domain-containing protein [Plesiomonas sp.]
MEHLLRQSVHYCAILLIAILTSVLTACGGGGEDLLAPPPGQGGGGGGGNIPITERLEITPVNQILPVGVTQQYTAIAYYSDGTQKNVTTQVEWRSSATNIAPIQSVTGSTPGLATTQNSGQTQIQATLTSAATSTQPAKQLLSNIALLNVWDAALINLTIRPATALIPVGNTQQYDAKVCYSNKLCLDTASLPEGVTLPLTWQNITGSSIASINSVTGLANGLQSGQATFSASIALPDGSTVISSNQAVLTVFDATLASIIISPVNTLIPKGGIQEYQATGQYQTSNGTIAQDVTHLVTWNSSNTAIGDAPNYSVGTVCTNSGTRCAITHGLADGTTTINATLGSITSNQATLRVVDANLLAIEITPPTWAMPIGGTNQYRAIGIYNNNQRFNLTNAVEWKTSVTNPIVATINSAGLATGTTAGNIKISATLTLPDGTRIDSNTADLTVWDANLVSLRIAPVSWIMPISAEKQFVLYGSYNNGQEYLLSSTAAQSWVAADTAIADITNTGLATGLSAGSTTLTATVWQPPYTSTPVNKTADLTVFDTNLLSVKIEPQNCITPVFGTNCEFIVLGQYDGVQIPQPIPSQYITWSYDNTIASLDINGQAIGLQSGITDITAIVTPPTGGATINSSNTAQLAVFDATLASIEITPNQHTMSTIGSTKQYQAFAHYSGIPSPVNITTLSGRQLQWSSSGAAATIDPATGIVTAQRVGNAFITATLTLPDNSVITPDLAINDDSNGDGKGDATSTVIDIATACEGVKGLFVAGTGCFSKPPQPNYSYVWSAASGYCQGLTTEGVTWLLPDNTQLTALDNAYANSELMNAGWEIYQKYWSSTPDPQSSGRRYYYSLSDGTSSLVTDDSYQGVTCLSNLP